MDPFKLIFITWFVSLTTYGEKCPGISSEWNGTFNQNLTGVVFNPYISYDPVMLLSVTEADCKLLLGKVHSRFNRIAIIHNPRDLTFKNDLIGSSLVAAAKLNRDGLYGLGKEIKITLGVVLGDSGQVIRDQVDYVVNILNKTQAIYPSIIDRVLVNCNLLTQYTPIKFRMFRYLLEIKAGSNYNYLIGLELDIKDFFTWFFSFLFEIENEHVRMVKNLVWEQRNFTSFYFQFYSVSNATYSDLKTFKKMLPHIKKFMPTDDIQLSATWEGDKKYWNINFTQVGNFWKTMNEFAEDMEMSVIIHQAFDSPLELGDTVGGNLNGWWRLIPSSKYLNVSDFKFEEKACLKNIEIGNEFERVNMAWLKEKRKFGKHFGVSLFLESIKSFISRDDMDKGLDKLVELISNVFSIIVIYVTAESTAAYDLKSITKLRLEKSKSFYVFNFFNENDLEFVLNLNSELEELAPKSFSRLVVDVVLNTDGIDPTWLEKTENIFERIRKSNQSQKYKWGAKMILPFCGYENLKRLNKLEVKLDLLIIVASTNWKGARVKAEESTAILTALLGACQSRVKHVFKDIELFFLTGWDTSEERDLLELVQFTALMNEWSETEKIDVLFYKAFDTSSNVKSGWWKMPEAGELNCESKQEAAIKIAMEKQPKKTSSGTTEIYAGSASFVLLIVAIAATIFYYIRKRTVKYLTKADIERFLNGEQPFLGSAYDKDLYEISNDKFQIKDELLGTGVFGKVFKGTVEKDNNCIEVAVKMTKDDCSIAAIKGLLNEIKILSYIGNHSNIVGLIGAYTLELRRNVAYVFLEYCGIGSLQDYLKMFVQEASGDEFEMTVINGELEKELGRFAREIAAGMEFMAGKNVVHMDLAARNILLTNDKTVKISDFGLSQIVKDKSFIKISRDELEPWRWMSPEALRKGEFVEKSDVWAFGVILWEIYSLGETPYPGIMFDVNFINCLDSGLRLKSPRYCKNQVYLIMTRCWEAKPEERPTFSQLKIILDDLNVN